jgi:16S rRNA pseudouridine516 synthase
MKRLDKILSDAGVAGRKELKDLIRAGRVRVDGVALTKADAKFDENAVQIEVDGELVCTERFVYYMMHKPEGVVTATEDREQKTVIDLLPDELKRRELFPVGRLDKDTTGLLILTNDGDYAHRVISPKTHVAKRYMAVTDGITDESDVKAFKEGIVLRDGTECQPAGLEITGTETCYVTLLEGKYHQVKRMLASRGKPVVKLHRCSIGLLELDENLSIGSFRRMTAEEVENSLVKMPL